MDDDEAWLYGDEPTKEAEISESQEVSFLHICSYEFIFYLFHGPDI